ncbi:BUD13 homolog isoform X2 [Passer montanus]|uniref:BUD13 homolog isoform X2 n=1 Tax=Passer montanus TaxID=9160 RepID=UPI00196223E3|nr:BUD13 homolog isoform X2 [Passer montanus]
MAAPGLSKAEYLRRYLSGAEPAAPRRRRRRKPPAGTARGGMRIVDDDVSWSSIAAADREEEEEDEGDMPVVAEFVDERPEEVKLMEEFRMNSKWKLLGDEDSQSSDISGPAKSATRRHHGSPEPSAPAGKHNGSVGLCAPRGQRDNSPEQSPPRRQRHDTPDPSPPRRQRHDTPDLSPPRRQRQDLSPRREKPGSPSGKKGRRKGRASPAHRDQPRSRSPPEPSLHHRDAKGSPKKAGTMASGVKAGLVSADVLQREKQELRKHERSTRHLEEESRDAQTVFRDKSGRKRNLAQEQLEQRLKAEAEAKREEQYAKWGKGLAQERQQQQNVEDAVKEMQKPLARYIDDQDLDRMLREQEREGDPMAALIKKRKAKENKEKEKPRYKGPAPPLNRFNIWPGHRWDGVDRSNGFEQQRFARIANKKAVQELAYKWSVEDM